MTALTAKREANFWGMGAKAVLTAVAVNPSLANAAASHALAQQAKYREQLPEGKYLTGKIASWERVVKLAKPVAAMKAAKGKAVAANPLAGMSKDDLLKLLASALASA